MKESIRAVTRTGIFAFLILILSYFGSGCGPSSSSAQSRYDQGWSIFKKKTMEKFGYTYACAFHTDRLLYVNDTERNIEGSTTADEYAYCIANGKYPLDIYLLDRSVNGLSDFEKQLILMPPPYTIGVDKGQNVEKVIADYYANMNLN